MRPPRNAQGVRMAERGPSSMSCPRDAKDILKYPMKSYNHKWIQMKQSNYSVWICLGDLKPPKKKYNKHFNTHRVISFKFPLTWHRRTGCSTVPGTDPTSGVPDPGPSLACHSFDIEPNPPRTVRSGLFEGMMCIDHPSFYSRGLRERWSWQNGKKHKIIPWFISLPNS